MEVEAPAKETHELGIVTSKKSYQRKVRCRRICLFLDYVLVKSGLAGCVSSVWESINSHGTDEQYDQRDKNHAIWIKFNKQLQISDWSHGENYGKNDNTRPRVAELGPVRRKITWRSVLATENLNDEQDDWKKVLGHQLEKNQDWHIKVDTEANHTYYPTFLPEILTQRLRIINIFASRLYHHPTGHKRDQECDQS